MSDLLALLQEFYREKLAAMLKHQAGSRLIPQYDQNNTYQYIINREEAHLAWVGKAIAELGATVADDQAEPSRGDGRRGDASHAILEEDARDAQAFVDRWRPRIDQMANARHAKMLRVILGEVLEQKRFFEQALAGRTDLLGRRADVLEPSHGEVLPTRWIE
ncbi:MAG TPA: hypothetical protein VKD69_25660 [Vicinamibacterales bacterium]|nr:hypothetical protein [Vicinamibacterales bacterium]